MYSFLFVLYNIFIKYLLFKQKKNQGAKMTKQTHTSGGFLIAAFAIYPFIIKFIEIYSFPYQILLIFLYFHFADLGSAFPDIDLKNSYVSKRYPLLSKCFGKNFKHRGFTHSIVFLLLLGYACVCINYISQFNIVVHSITYGFYIGYGSHIILDLFNPQGVELFYPCKYNFKIFKIKTNSTMEKLFNGVLNILSSILIIYYCISNFGNFVHM